MLKSKISDDKLTAYIEGNADEKEKLEVLQFLSKAPSLLLSLNCMSFCMKSCWD